MRNHLKSLAAPKTWVLLRKETVFVARPKPGAHSMKLGMPLSLVFKNILKIASTTKEVKRLLLQKEVLVDGRKVKDHRRIVGLMDTIRITHTNEVYRMILDMHGKLTAVPITDTKEQNIKITRVLDKKILGKNKVQLNLLGARNITVEKDTFKTGDSLVIEVPSQKIVETLRPDKGMFVYIIGGKHSGDRGTVERIGGRMILFKNAQGDIITTLKRYALVIGKTKPLVQLE